MDILVVVVVVGFLTCIVSSLIMMRTIALKMDVRQRLPRRCACRKVNPLRRLLRRW